MTRPPTPADYTNSAGEIDLTAYDVALDAYAVALLDAEQLMRAAIPFSGHAGDKVPDRPRELHV